MKFCDLRCTSHLRKKSYTVFLSDLMKMDVLVTKTTKKKKYLKSLTWFLSLIICTVQYFGPVIRSPLPPPPNLCTEFGQHVGGLRIISWPCTSLAGMCRLFWGGFPDRRQLCSITRGPPHSQTRLQEFFHLEKRRVNEVGLSSNPILRFGFRDIRC